MLDLTIPDMTCGGCARGVTAAVKELDPAAELVIDIEARKVRVKTSASDAAVRQAIAGAGFSPV